MYSSDLSPLLWSFHKDQRIAIWQHFLTAETRKSALKFNLERTFCGDFS